MYILTTNKRTGKTDRWINFGDISVNGGYISISDSFTTVRLSTRTYKLTIVND